MTVRLGYLVSHAIQYQAPLLRRLATRPELDLDVYFQSDLSTGAHFDRGFGGEIEWDVPLLDGYRSRTLAAHPLNRLGVFRASDGLFAALEASGKSALWVHGFASPYYAWVIERALRRGLQVFVRDEVQQTGNRRIGWRETVKGRLLRSWSRRGVGFLAIGSLNRQYYLGKGVDPASIFCVPYAVDRGFFERRAVEGRADRQRLRRALGLDADATVILFASKLIERKGGLDLIEAFRRAVPRLRMAGVAKPCLVFAGSGEQAGSLMRAAAGLPATFLGFQNQTALARLFGLVDLFVLPSRREPWGLVVNEAMSAGLPVVVSDEVGCRPDLVADGVNGRVYAAGDVGALADALTQVLSDPARPAAMGRESRRIIAGWGYEQDVEGILQAAAWSEARRSGGQA